MLKPQPGWRASRPPDDAYLAYICMFRYAFGRMTCMPDVIIEIIYGMECDRQTWLAFHEWVRKQIAKRKAKEGAEE